MYFQEGPYITEWFTVDQVAYIREKETQVYEHVRDVIDRGIASGEFYDCDSHVLALGYIGMTLAPTVGCDPRAGAPRRKSQRSSAPRCCAA